MAMMRPPEVGLLLADWLGAEQKSNRVRTSGFLCIDTSMDTP